MRMTTVRSLLDARAPGGFGLPDELVAAAEAVNTLRTTTAPTTARIEHQDAAALLVAEATEG